MVMSIFRVFQGANPIENLYDRINYVIRPDAAKLAFIYGAWVSPIFTYEQMVWVKEIFDQMDGKAFHHCLFNPRNDDKYNVESYFYFSVEVAEILSAFAERKQVLMAIHFDEPPGLHTHFIVNNVGMETGVRFDLWKPQLRYLKEQISAAAYRYGLSRCCKSC